MLRTSPYFDDDALWDPLEIMALRYDSIVEDIPLDRSFQRHSDYARFMGQLYTDELSYTLQRLQVTVNGKRNKANMIRALKDEVWERLPALITILPTRSYQMLLELVDEGGELIITEPLLVEAAELLHGNGLGITRLSPGGQSVVLRAPDDLVEHIQALLPQISDDRETLGVDRIMMAVDRLLDAYGVIATQDVFAMFTRIGLLDGSAFSEGLFAALLRGFDHSVIADEGEEVGQLYICDMLVNSPADVHRQQALIGRPAPFDAERLLTENPDDYVLFAEEASCLESMLSFFDPLLDEEEDVMLGMQTVAGAIKQGFDEEIVVFLGIESLGPQPFDVYEALRQNAKTWMNRMNLWTLNGYAQSTVRGVRRQDIGRNDPCPCGSGKKYKHCCGNPLRVIK